MKICFVGSGYVGLVSAACFAEIGNEVICVDNDENKINSLKNGVIPFFEPGLEDLVKRNVDEDKLSFTTNLKLAVIKSEIIFLAVGTPQKDGSLIADLKFVDEAFNSILEIAKNCPDQKLLVIKSTVPIGTGETYYNKALAITNKIRVANNPEFLKEGSAIDDFMEPDRIIFGTSDYWSENILSTLYDHFQKKNKLIFSMSQTSAEIVKYASNSMLAMRISFMNEMAMIADAAGADINDVIEGVGSDTRIGSKFLSPGPGFGGSCFKKDLSALYGSSLLLGVPSNLARTTLEVNQNMQVLAVDILQKKFGDLEGKNIGVLGLSFKPHTDDVRDSSSIFVIQKLQGLGARILAHDPVAVENFKKVIGSLDGIQFLDDSSDLLFRSDAVILMTDWDEYQNMNADALKHRVYLLDMRRSAEIFSIHSNIEYYGFGIQ